MNYVMFAAALASSVLVFVIMMGAQVATAELQIVDPIIVDSNVIPNQTEPTPAPTPKPTPEPTPAPRKSKKNKSKFVYGDPNTVPNKKKKSSSDGGRNQSGPSDKHTKHTDGKNSKSGSDGKKSKSSSEGWRHKGSDDSDRPSRGGASGLTKGFLGEAFSGFHHHRDYDDD